MESQPTKVITRSTPLVQVSLTNNRNGSTTHEYTYLIADARNPTLAVHDQIHRSIKVLDACKLISNTMRGAVENHYERRTCWDLSILEVPCEEVEGNYGLLRRLRELCKVGKEVGRLQIVVMGVENKPHTPFKPKNPNLGNPDRASCQIPKSFSTNPIVHHAHFLPTLRPRGRQSQSQPHVPPSSSA